MDDERFEQLVSDGIDAIPARFLDKLKNVAIVIADNPTSEQLSAGHVHEGSLLLGLYQGVPLTARGDFYGMGMQLPDTITLFKDPIIRISGHDEDRIRLMVRDTVWHEIAHYFGYDDEEIEEREARGTNHSH